MTQVTITQLQSAAIKLLDCQIEQGWTTLPWNKLSNSEKLALLEQTARTFASVGLDCDGAMCFYKGLLKSTDQNRGLIMICANCIRQLNPATECLWESGLYKAEYRGQGIMLCEPCGEKEDRLMDEQGNDHPEIIGKYITNLKNHDNF